jgi:hypothetical protein
MKAFVVLLVLVLAAGAGVYFFGGSASEPQPVAGVETRAETEEAAQRPPSEQLQAVDGSEQEVQEAKTEKKKELPPEYRLYFPDGTYLPALNGAKNPKPVEFEGRPYAPVVRKAYDPKYKVYWYVHADGSYSTTRQMNFRGQKNSVTQVAHPGVKPEVVLDDTVPGEPKIIPLGSRKKAPQTPSGSETPPNGTEQQAPATGNTGGGSTTGKE